MMNSVNLIGNLTKDAELRYSQKGKAYLKGIVAVQRRFEKDEADFITFTMFNKGAEIFSNYTGKGSKVGLEGRIQTGRYEDKDGKTVFTTDVIVENFTFLDGKQDNQQNQPSREQLNKQAVGEPASDNPFKQDGEPIEIDDSSLPF